MATQNPAAYALDRSDCGLVRLSVSGQWQLGGQVPKVAQVRKELAECSPKRLLIEGQPSSWDSSLMVFLQDLCDYARELGAEIETKDLLAGPRGLLALSEAVAEKKDAARKEANDSFFTMLGHAAFDFGKELCSLLSFVGECLLAVLLAIRGKAKFRWRDFWLITQQCGAEALPIVTLLSFLVGLIFAFVGAIQLQQFGAAIFVANLVGISMMREMGAIITGVIMSGRTGAAFAAAIGSMKVNEEVDALKTLGISPIEFLVLPRLMALFIMMPMLVVFSNVVGILGGMFVSAVLFDITPAQYIAQTILAVNVTQLFAGISKSFVFAVLVAAAGCLRGLQCGNGSEAVGQATTSAVVTGITAIIVADAIFAFIFEILHI